MAIKDPIVFRVNDCRACGLQTSGFEREDPMHELYKETCDSCGEPWEIMRYDAEELCRGAVIAVDDAVLEEGGDEVEVEETAP